MVLRVWVPKTAGFPKRMANVQSWSLHDPFGYAGPQGNRSKLPSRSLDPPYAVRVTHVTTHGFRKPPALYASKDAELCHQDVRGVNLQTMSGLLCGHMLHVALHFAQQKHVR